MKRPNRSRKSQTRKRQAAASVAACVETLRQLQRQAIQKFIALLQQDERVKGRGYRLFVPRADAEDAFLSSPTLILVLPRPTRLNGARARRRSRR